MLRIFIGYDERETVAYHTLSNSIIRQSSRPVAITPLYLPNLQQHYRRQHDNRQSNAFSFSRFLIPHLCDYQGMALYMDCDMLLMTDINDVFEEYANQDHAVSVVKHDYVSRVTQKYLNQKQYNYPRKNWSSFVLWNCEHAANKIVTPEFVNSEEPATLHRFLWLKDEEIGALDVTWNWLVGEYDIPKKNIKNIHWTLGGPYFNDYANVDFAKEWHDEKQRMTWCSQVDEAQSIVR